MRVGDSTTLAVTISGTGNIMDAPAPAIPAPTEFKTYADNPEAQIQPGPQGYSGNKVFRTALVPVQPGQYRIDPIVLTYFDVESGGYRDISTSPFDVTVSPSDTAAADIDVFRGTPAQTPSLKKRVEFTGRDILPLKEGLDALKPQRSMPPMWFGLFMAIPALLFLAVRTVMQMAQKDDSPGRIMADRAREALKSAASADTTDADFLSALYRALVSAILGRQGVMGTSLTWSEASDRLLEIGWNADDATATARLLEAIESFNYSGGNLDMQKRADLLEQDPASGAETDPMKAWVLTTGSLVLLLAVAATAPATQNARTFMDGTEAYRNGDWPAAIAAFESLADSGVDNGKLFYNLGNAYLKNDDLGRALLWYERALKRIPDDPDLRFNYDYALTLTKDERGQKESPLLRILFFWKYQLSHSSVRWMAIFLNAALWTALSVLCFAKNVSCAPRSF